MKSAASNSIIPDGQFRPLKLIHDWGVSGLRDQAERRSKIDSILERLKRLGYGGIVTNVDMQGYLEDGDNWETLRYIVPAARRQGFRVWLYDEHGYPSGGAGGITLRDHPEYEALALAEVTAVGAPGTEVEIGLPRGHMYFIRPDGTEGTYVTARADSSGTARAYAVKPVYEGTHAEHNVHESRRYINVLSFDAVHAFAENTYMAYARELGDALNEVEAIFTDEPSIMAAYINAGLYPGRVRDKFDDTLPLLPIVPWARELPGKYREMWGEELAPKLPHLFGPATAETQETRYRFFSTTSALFENAYYRQLGEVSERLGLNFSGHVLLEEELLHHPVFEGNIFRFVSHMGIPGIDMLTTIPEGVLRQAATPKLISSSAHWFGRPHVMSEVSGHMEGATRRAFGAEEMKGSVTLQRALGVDTFPSYYSDTAVGEEAFRQFCDYTANLCGPLSGDNVQTGAKVLLLYPVESAFAATSGTDRQLGERPHTAAERRMEASWQGLIRELLLEGIEFECVDAKELTHVDIAGGRLVHPASGRKFDALAVPFMSWVPEMIRELLDGIDAENVQVVRDSEGTPETLAAAVCELKKRVQPSARFIPEHSETGEAEGETRPVLTVSFLNTCAYRQAFLAVNYTAKPCRGQLELNISPEIGSAETLRPELIDPEDGKPQPLKAEVCGGKITVHLEFRPGRGLIVGIK